MCSRISFESLGIAATAKRHQFLRKIAASLSHHWIDHSTRFCVWITSSLTSSPYSTPWMPQRDSPPPTSCQQLVSRKRCTPSSRYRFRKFRHPSTSMQMVLSEPFKPLLLQYDTKLRPVPPHRHEKNKSSVMRCGTSTRNSGFIHAGGTRQHRGGVSLVRGASTEKGKEKLISVALVGVRGKKVSVALRENKNAGAWDRRAARIEHMRRAVWRGQS